MLSMGNMDSWVTSKTYQALDWAEACRGVSRGCGVRRRWNELQLQPEWIAPSEYLRGDLYFGGVGIRGRASKSRLRVHGRTLGPNQSGARRGSKTESDWTRMKSRREGLFDIRTWLPTVHVVNYLYGSVASPNIKTIVRER